MNQIQVQGANSSANQSLDVSPQQSEFKHGILTHNSNPTTGGRFGSTGPYVETTDQEYPPSNLNFSNRLPQEVITEIHNSSNSDDYDNMEHIYTQTEKEVSKRTGQYKKERGSDFHSIETDLSK